MKKKKTVKSVKSAKAVKKTVRKVSAKKHEIDWTNKRRGVLDPIYERLVKRGIVIERRK